MPYKIYQKTSQTLTPVDISNSSYQLNILADKITDIETPSGISPINVSEENEDISSNSDFTYNFQDSGIKLKGGVSFQSSSVYFLKLKIKRPVIEIPNTEDEEEIAESELIKNITSALKNKTITFKLFSSTVSDTSQQFIQEYTIPFVSTQRDSQEEHYSIVELVFRPLYDNFDSIGFILNRTVEDLVAIYLNKDGDGAEEVRTTQVDFDIDDVENKLFAIPEWTQADLETPLKNIIKIGVQGTPGLLMCINGEGIRLGPSGMFEIKNGYAINSLSFLVENNQQRFILDYETNS